VDIIPACIEIRGGFRRTEVANNRRIQLKDGSFVNFSRRYPSRLNHLFH
jgi:hypothetical protein